jgi:hypothetical protein
MKEFRSMKITQDAREFAKEQNIEEEKALAVGKAEKSKEFLSSGRGNLSRQYSRRRARTSLKITGQIYENRKSILSVYFRCGAFSCFCSLRKRPKDTDRSGKQ